MESRLPTYQEMLELVAFLPHLYSEGFKPVTKWNGGDQGADGIFRMPWPEYNPLVQEFYWLAARECWMDYGYRPEDAAAMLKDDEVIKAASLPEIKTMLTYCVRGERFSDGHWAEMIENGSIRKILERINQLSVDTQHQVNSG